MTTNRTISTPSPADAGGKRAGFALRAGRRAAPYTDAHDWVGLSGIDPEAHSLYVKLKMHVNQRRADAKCWPGKRSLALMMGYRKEDSLGRHLDQLEAIGAVDVVRGGMPAKNTYFVNDLPAERYCTVSGWPVAEDRCRPCRTAGSPPCGTRPYDGPLTLADWYDASAKVLAERTAQSKAKQARQRGRPAEGQVSLDTPAEGYQATTASDTPENGYQEPPHSGELDTPATGVEQAVREQAVNEQAPPPYPHAGEPAAAALPRQGGGGDPQRTQTEAAGRILDGLLDDVVEVRRPRGNGRTRLLAALADRLADGWTPAQLDAALAGSFAGAGAVGAVLAARIRDLDGPPPTLSSSRPPREPCADVACDSQRGGAGFVERGDRVVPCPACRAEQRARHSGSASPVLAGVS